MNMQAEKRLIRARSALITSQPFFGSLCLSLQMVEDSTISTMATDGEKLFYCPDFVLSLNESQLIGVCAHEVLHCAYKHHTRRGNRDAEKWNIAADYAINLDLVDAGFVLPKNTLLDYKFAGMGAEQIYTLIPEPEKEQSKSCGQVLDAPGGEPGKSSSNAEWSTKVAQAVSVTKAQAGTLPGHLDRLANANRAPQVDWREQLRRFIDQSTIKDYSWSRPNRRFIASGLILPGIVADAVSKIAIVIDTSGSITDETLEGFQAEIAATLDDNATDAITVVYCDSKVNRVEEFERGDIVKLSANGGGGTNFRPAFDWLEENATDAALIIYLTDMMTSDFGDAPDKPVVWAGYGMPKDLQYQAERAGFGELVHVQAG